MAWLTYLQFFITPTRANQVIFSLVSILSFNSASYSFRPYEVDAIIIRPQLSGTFPSNTVIVIPDWTRLFDYLLNTWWLVPRGTVSFVSRGSQCFPRRSRGKQWDSRKIKFTVLQGTSDLLYSKTNSRKTKQILKTTSVSRWDSSDNIRPPSIARSDHVQSDQHFAVNCELFPVWRHSFRIVACSWQLG